jgi:hypothetical protein
MWMKGFITKSVAGVTLGASLSLLAGCVCYRKAVDPCWPERYNALSRASVAQAVNAQAYNGHVLDQTIYDYFFAPDKDGRPTDVLHPAGLERLKYLARRRPVPDLHIFLQTAQDIPYVPGAADKAIAARAELDTRRIQAIQAYMSVLLAPCGITTPVQVTVIDPGPDGINGIFIGGSMQPGRDLPVIGAIQKLWLNAQGLLPVNFMAGGGTSGGSTGGGTSGGGGGGGGGGAGFGGR